MTKTATTGGAFFETMLFGDEIRYLHTLMPKSYSLVKSSKLSKLGRTISKVKYIDSEQGRICGR
jgi:hypothetical protein